MAHNRWPHRRRLAKLRPSFLQVGILPPSIAMGSQLLLLLAFSFTFPRIPNFWSHIVGSAIGFVVFTVLLSSWALTFAIGGERLFGLVWGQLVRYNVADRLGLTGWN
ncbi:hypothetical protein HHK36_030477 [Tetracentron sinense]|uniref:Uncharacterized protein n=1 Tax=Tetracentron sinense TaxID=13715 RepID=A0A834Y9N2_TETSI|nr:hypothetical protein HHK36_030477 [Tetracentron sinense]